MILPWNKPVPLQGSPMKQAHTSGWIQCERLLQNQLHFYSKPQGVWQTKQMTESKKKSESDRAKKRKRENKWILENKNLSLPLSQLGTPRPREGICSSGATEQFRAESLAIWPEMGMSQLVWKVALEALFKITAPLASMLFYILWQGK